MNFRVTYLICSDEVQRHQNSCTVIYLEKHMGSPFHISTNKRNKWNEMGNLDDRIVFNWCSSKVSVAKDIPVETKQILPRAFNSIIKQHHRSTSIQNAVVWPLESGGNESKVDIVRNFEGLNMMHFRWSFIRDSAFCRTKFHPWAEWQMSAFAVECKTLKSDVSFSKMRWTKYLLLFSFFVASGGLLLVYSVGGSGNNCGGENDGNSLAHFDRCRNL